MGVDNFPLSGGISPINFRTMHTKYASVPVNLIIIGQDDGIGRQLHDRIDHPILRDFDLPPNRIVIGFQGLFARKFMFQGWVHIHDIVG